PYTFPDYPEMYAGWNVVSSIGSYISFASVILFVIFTIYALKFGKRASANYWDDESMTLEWTLPSPPPFHQFEDQPIVK
ncbi:MAG TPA: cytochrome c oxidase subunit I, partial [Alphaproteobacteria bacterium]|nr:cytochrome c oxidase subunit I [Alphaproteobacteria bacterium]